MWTRRAFLKGGVLALFASSLGGSPLFLARAAQASAGKKGGQTRVLVALFQRGAMDGLMAVTPFRDPDLVRMRPSLALTAAKSAGEEALIDLDGRFGLHPALAALAPLYKAGQLAIVHGVGSPYVSRSHFDAQDYMESGTPGQKGTPDGWLNRAIGLLGPQAGPLRAVSLTSSMPRVLSGSAPAVAISDLNDFGIAMPGAEQTAQRAEKSFEALYARTSQSLLRGAGQESFQALQSLAGINPNNYLPARGADYPQGQLGSSLRQIAQLIKSDVGLEVAFTESGGWDTHAQQGTTRGQFARHAQELSRSLAAFWTDLGADQERVTLMTMTEFGRTVHENGAGGTDHGRASCLFVLGHDVLGGQVLGTVPELKPEALEEGRDLPVTTDFRAVFADVAGAQLGIDNDQVLFPGWSGSRLPVIRRDGNSGSPTKTQP